MDLIDNEGVLRRNQPVLEPAPGDARGHDDHVPRRCFRGRLPFSIDHTDLQRRLENGLGHAADGECLAGARSSHDPKPPARSRKPANVVAVLAFQQCLEVEAQRQFYGLAGGTRGSDDDDAAS